MLAIIFGLSSDYEVFVVSRIKEEYTKNGDARRAVQRGTGLSARVVTAAALIMFSIFVAFMFTNDPTIKAIGFSFAAGVFLDAFVVRLTLVPAVMAIVRVEDSGTTRSGSPGTSPTPTSRDNGSSTGPPSSDSLSPAVRARQKPGRPAATPADHATGTAVSAQPA